MRRGPNYVLRAIDDNDREVRVVVDARSGDIAVGDADANRIADAAAAGGGVTHGSLRADAAGLRPAGLVYPRRLSRRSAEMMTTRPIRRELYGAAAAGSCARTRRRVGQCRAAAGRRLGAPRRRGR